MKKISLILIAILSLAAIGFATWFIFVRDKTIPAREAIVDILPFGSGEDFGNVTLEEEGVLVAEEDESLMFDERGNPLTEIFRISNTPVAGMIILSRGGQPVVRYVERATGHIYETTLPSSTSTLALEKRRITNNTLPGIYEAYFRQDGNAVLLRSLRDNSDVIENVSLTLTPPPTSSTSTEALHSISAANLRGDIGSVGVGTGDNLFYSLTDSGVIASAPFSGSSVSTIFNSTFTDWRVVSRGNGLVLQTKASARAPGYAYSLNITNGTLSKILGPLNGLTVNPDISSSRVFYAYKNGDFSRSGVINTQDGSITEVSPATLAEKCVWSRRSIGTIFCAVPVESMGVNEPDNWYQGKTSFYDRIWRFDTNLEITQVLVEPRAKYNIDIDAINLQLSANEDYLVFINKSDLSLWAFRLPR